jgi:PPM family protein phosphatase
MEVICSRREMAAAACLKGTRHQLYEDSYRMFPNEIPLVRDSNRGEIYAVFDGIGSAVKGKESSQAMADILIEFYQAPEFHEPSAKGLYQLLQKGNMLIHDWGFEGENDVPLGGCAGTLIWIYDSALHLFHAGDTVAGARKNISTRWQEKPKAVLKKSTSSGNNQLGLNRESTFV